MNKLILFGLILSIMISLNESANVRQVAGIKMAKNLVRKFISNQKLQQDVLAVLDDLTEMNANELKSMLEMGKLLLSSQGLSNNEDQE